MLDTVDLISDHLLDAVLLTLLHVELMDDLIFPAVPVSDDFKFVKVDDTLLFRLLQLCVALLLIVCDALILF